ncbi:hypothetical protein [Streptomyces sp. NPDC046685]|uniref:hypothetical protein n=1 Tax=Streptomyces sp. NPDC046685 TaxID=3157202 RepID=UPI0033FE51AD
MIALPPPSLGSHLPNGQHRPAVAPFMTRGNSGIRLRGSGWHDTAHTLPPQRAAGWGTNEDGAGASIDPGGSVPHRPLADAWAVYSRTPHRLGNPLGNTQQRKAQ